MTPQEKLKYELAIQVKNKMNIFKLATPKTAAKTAIRPKIYPNYKYDTEYVPWCIHMPSDEVMIKIMRSCCFVERVQDLIYYAKGR